MVSKRGSEKYYIIISLILGLMVLALGLFFIFNEYFTDDELDWQQCRQSIVLRAGLPEVEGGPVTVVSFKDDFPLKCRTDVIDITGDDIENGDGGKIIADALVQCWNLFGNGDYEVFPSSVYGMSTTCVPCARIHLTEGAKELLGEDGKIDIEETLRTKEFDGVSYLNYLNGVGNKFEPFNLAFSRPFNLSGDSFKIERAGFIPVFLADEFKTKDGLSDKWGRVGSVELPKYFYSNQSDLIVVIGAITTSKDSLVDYVPYLFYYPISQQNKFSEEAGKTFLRWGWTGIDPAAWEGICMNWEGVPA